MNIIVEITAASSLPGMMCFVRHSTGTDPEDGDRGRARHVEAGGAVAPEPGVRPGPGVAGAGLQPGEVGRGRVPQVPPAGGRGRVGDADGGQPLQGLQGQRGRVARGGGQLPSAANSPDWRHHGRYWRTHSGLSLKAEYFTRSSSA